jgi:hypothetical protein
MLACPDRATPIIVGSVVFRADFGFVSGLFRPEDVSRELSDRKNSYLTLPRMVTGRGVDDGSDEDRDRPQFEMKVGADGFEPSTTCTPCRCATRLRYAP